MRVVKQKLKVTHKNKSFGKDGLLEFETDIQEAESLAEAITWAGGEKNMLDIANWAALSKAKGKLRTEANATVGDGEREKTLEEFLEVAESIFSEMKPVAGRTGMSAKVKAENFDEFAKRYAEMQAAAVASGEDVDPAELRKIAVSLGM